MSEVITTEIVTKIARLARLHMEENDKARVAGEINSIMTWIEQLSEVNTDGIEPLTSVVDMEMYQRPDVVTDGGYAEAVLKNAPEKVEGFFVVPKVVE
jgi:aspartyl-tRNA(Asn)/glutamyl-tRNA(Gln) amidotransferase subunit C